MAPGWFRRRPDAGKAAGGAASGGSSRSESWQPSSASSSRAGPPSRDAELAGGFGQQVVGPTGSTFSAASAPQRVKLKDARYSDLRYTKFVIDGFEGEKHAVLVPDSMNLSLPVLRQICAALDQPIPSLLLSGISSLCHTSRMSNAQLRSCSGLSQLMEEAKWSIAGEGTAASNDERLVEVVNRVLEKKVAGAVGLLASVAKRTNAWTYTGPQISNLEMFLQQCIESSDTVESPGDTDVFRVAAAHMQDRSYMESPISQQLMRYLFESSQEMSTEGVSYVQPVLLKGDLWDPGAYTLHPEFAQHGFEYWSFDALDQKMVTGHPVALWPWPHANLFLLFYREREGRQAEVDWTFRTPRKLDEEAVPFNPEVLAPLGHVFFGAPSSWGTRMKKTLLRGMKVTRPLVLMDNTANVAKHVCLCIAAIKKVWDRSPVSACRGLFEDAAAARLGSAPTAVDLIQALSPSKILQHVRDSFDTSGMDVQEKLTLGDIVGILDIAKRRPRAFREMLCLLDPLADPSDSLALLMGTFTSHQTCSKEANPSTVHRSLVLKAWGLHVKLSRNELQLRRSLTAIVVCPALALVLTVSIAMVMVALSQEENLSVWMRGVVRGLHMSLIALPISAALLTIVRDNFQVAQKWAEAHMAAASLISEIYHFLGEVGPYAGGPASSQRRFLKRLQSLGKRCAGEAWTREEDLAAGWEKVFADDPEQLQQHVDATLYPSRPSPCRCRCLRRLLGALVDRSRFEWTRLLLNADPQDLAAPVTAETYMELRMLPLKTHYADMLRWLTQLHHVLIGVVCFFLFASLILAAVGAPTLIPVTLGIAALAAGATQWATPSGTVEALRSALHTLNGFEGRWHSTDVVENRSLATKVSFITTTERVALTVARSLSPATLLPELLEGEDRDIEAEDGSEKALEENLREQRWRPISVEVVPPQDQ